MRTQTVGTAGSREFIVQWTNVTRFDEDTLRFTFQLRLRETSNEIVFAYYLQGAPPTAPGAVVSGMNGNEASVGIENATGTIGLQYSFDTASLANNLLIRFVPSGCFSGGGTPTATVGTTTPTTTATTTPVLSNKLYLPLIMR